MGALGNENQIAGITRKLETAQDERERQAAERALESIANRSGARCAEIILASYKEAKPDSRVVLLRLLGMAGGPRALEAVRTAFQEGDPAVRQAALRVLADWSNADAAPDLLRLAQTCDNPNWSLLAFRGYVRLCRESQNSASEKIQMLSEALKLARTAAQKRLVIAALGDLPQPAALSLLSPFFEDADLVEVTSLAVLRVASSLDPKSSDEIAPALKKVVKLSTNPDVQDQAKKMLEKMGAAGQ